ncbi:hypothetical protein HZC20_03625 [Candidatus Peregrinibacteria bacterium]|nr:hypothetical protein [Candidatus Peregrinibacteria bacterium]
MGTNNRMIGNPADIDRANRIVDGLVDLAIRALVADRQNESYASLVTTQQCDGVSFSDLGFDYRGQILNAIRYARVGCSNIVNVPWGDVGVCRDIERIVLSADTSHEIARVIAPYLCEGVDSTDFDECYLYIRSRIELTMSRCTYLK